MIKMYRNTFVEINLENIAHNIKTIVKKYDYKYYIGVIKGNCYGHGYGIVKTLKENGVNFFAVSNLSEALEVREFDKETGILCLEPIDIKYLEMCKKNNISICVDDYDYYKELVKLNLNIKVHLKIDSGMNRLGFNNKDEVDKVYQDIKKHKNIYLEGIFTHFATSGIYDKNYDNQVDKFKELTSDIDLSKIDIVHLGRSVSMCLHEKLSFANGIRLGIIMYGFSVMPKANSSLKGKLRELKWNYLRKKENISKIRPYEELGLKEAFTLVSEVLEIKNVKKGDFIGYGTTYQAKEDMKVAIVDIGYADGISRRRRYSKMEINGKLYDIVGDVCMGMTMLKVDDTIKKHDKVIVIGDMMNIRKVARDLGTTSYEVMTMISPLLERKYI